MAEEYEVTVDDSPVEPVAAPTEEKKPGSDDIEIVVEGEEPAKVDEEAPEDEILSVKKQLDELQEKIRAGEQRELQLAQELQQQRRKVQQPEVKTETKEETLTNSQLLEIMREHKDNPEVMLNVMNYMAEKKAQEIRDKTVSDIDKRTWYQNLNSIEERALTEDKTVTPDLRDKLPQIATSLGLADHPLGRFLSLLAYRATNEQPNSESEAAEKTRQQKLVTSKGLDKTKSQSKTTVTLTKEQMDVAKQFGISPKLYAQFVPKGDQ